MNDPHETWRAARAYQARHYTSDLIERAFPGAGRLLDPILTLAPVVEQGEWFELAPDLAQRAPISRHRWLIAVRRWDGLQIEGEPGETEAARMRAAIGPAAEPLRGDYIEDIIACDAKLSRVRGQYTGHADTLGTMDDDQPVRLLQTPLAWLRGLCAGVVLLGSAMRKQTLLRGHAPGVICDSVEHGEAVQRLMRRDLPELPPVMVAG